MNSVKSFVASLALALFVSSAVSAADAGKAKATNYKVNASKSELTWLGKKVTGEHTGKISLKEGVITMDGAKLTGGKFVADLTSITCTDLTDKEYNGKLIGHLKSDDFFSVEKHPTATFVVTKVAPKSAGVYDVTGNLTIKGITKPTTFPVTVKTTSTGAEATGTLVVDRSKYDIKYNSKSFFENLGDKMINDDFTIDVKLVAAK
ncbi:YceI family protein [Dyadobacter psychrotolerans]|uniref:YceI family protein n=1 Tax=Dyadobacter psychrotolerans TaxID=2541721 RepID=A0A4R5DUI3_9BACT|nr:YceI family protein [Dyadobacter psychrotolerans]TDE18196.1 YceI family protein [Dyadobacter psychrotolerans]